MIAGPSTQEKRQVLVYKLNGGTPITGELRELRKTGLRMAVPSAMAPGEVVRLILPSSDRRPSSSGRTMIGHVVGSGAAASGHLVGIDFGWEADLSGSSSPAAPKRRPWWRRLISS